MKINWWPFYIMIPWKVKGFAAKTWWFFVLIRKDKMDDNALIKHEEVHISQTWRLPIIHNIWYNLSDRYRLKCELEAYAVHVREHPMQHWDHYIDHFANSIANNYNLSITEVAARRLLYDRVFGK